MVEYMDVLVAMVMCLGLGIGTGFILGVNWATYRSQLAAEDIRSDACKT